MALVEQGPLCPSSLFVALVVVIVTAVTFSGTFFVYHRPSPPDEDNAPLPPPRLCLSSVAVSLLPWGLSPSLVLCGVLLTTTSLLIASSHPH